jgi:hypothetical protein
MASFGQNNKTIRHTLDSHRTGGRWHLGVYLQGLLFDPEDGGNVFVSYIFPMTTTDRKYLH